MARVYVTQVGGKLSLLAESQAPLAVGTPVSTPRSCKPSGRHRPSPQYLQDGEWTGRPAHSHSAEEADSGRATFVLCGHNRPERGH